jgi:hypothetical protein
MRVESNESTGSALESRSVGSAAIRDLTPVTGRQVKTQDLTPTVPTVRRLAEDDLPAVLARDRAVFGADRGALLLWALATAPDLAWISTSSGAPAYCLGRHGDHSDQVGPVVAEDAAVARDLVRACLAVPRSRPLIVDARVEPSWLETLGAMGFREQRPFTRMYAGEARPPARPALEPIVFGPEFG